MLGLPACRWLSGVLAAPRAADAGSARDSAPQATHTMPLVVATMSVRIITGDSLTVLRTLESESAQCVVTSPPYAFLRSYLPADHPDKAKEIGSEPTPKAFVAALVEVFREVKRVLRRDGILVCNLGDSYSGSGKGPSNSLQRPASCLNDRQLTNGAAPTGWQGTQYDLPPKNLLMIPFRVAMAMQGFSAVPGAALLQMADGLAAARRDNDWVAVEIIEGALRQWAAASMIFDGWTLRSVMPWVKRNSMPESVTDRPASAIEYLFLFARSSRYFWDAEAIRIPSTTNDPRRPYTSDGAWEIDGRPVDQRHGGQRRAGDDFSSRSYRNSDPFFATWQGLMLDEDGDPLALVVNPQPSSLEHFASYPPALVEPFVKAGTSQKGACPACGAPWARTTERSRSFQSGSGRAGNLPAGKNGLGLQGGGETLDIRRGPVVQVETTGWAPSCTCDAGEPVPCVVLDPFLGSGTTAMVADRLQRDAIGIELSPAYADMARQRLQRDAGPMFADSIVVAS